ncbi:threonine aldolase [Nocardioides sp. MAH-18]|uniref:Threonine aldolase n=1 Tax=Nocardioides agri TaxID=2682843 RepID=A0A6L6Y296_9ACTN|nr:MULTISPECIES: beta-eliminating lyase-related protein [unclassified Nocardioides]MBA2952562.1 threonine aldolase [Nocardioides sp. CGMCC 1.13656]MVQ51725.1 threonine aldolase [Nocardioides sp. MAH-18]
MADDELATRVRAAARACATAVSGHHPGSPAEAFEALARVCEELGIDSWDTYGSGGAVTMLEDDLVERFGVEAAAYFPSGVMAQQAALRIHCDRAGSRRVALPDLSHLLVHEEDGPRILHDLEVVFLTTGFEAPTAAHLDALPGRVGAVLVELPLREAGCLLPTWEELDELSAACRERGVALHVDGARIWESQAWFDQPLSEIARRADSTYVSFYKGLGGLTGAALLGPADFVAEARLWRRRLGGTTFRATAEAVSALAGLREQLPLLPDTVAWARSFAAGLPAELAVQPGVPQTNQFLLFANGDADAANERTAAAIEEHRIGLPVWSSTDQPGRIRTEVVVSPTALALDPAAMADLVAGLIVETRSGS